MAPPDDATLLAGCRNPATRQRAYRQLVEAYQRPLYAHIRRLVGDHDAADDVLQTTFVKAWRALDRLRDDARLSPWLYKIATNEALSHLRAAKRRRTQPLEDVPQQAQANQEALHDTATDLPQGEEALLQRLQQAIQSLPPRQRTVFTLRYYDDMPYDQMAQALGKTPGALKASYHHAMLKVKAYILGH